MIYFDNAATTLMKPPAVAKAVLAAMGGFGNPSRSAHGPAMEAAHAVYAARCEIARLTGLDDPLCVAFTSSATESLNLIADMLLAEGSHVVTTVLEHNSVLRPLYRKGCRCTFLGCDKAGRLRYDMLPEVLTPDVRAVIMTHGSNVTGNISDAGHVYALCKERGIPFVLDAAQTMGSAEVRADMADIIVFTGHKGLFGPQGTGGLIISGDIYKRLKIHKTGGTGSGGAVLQPHDMPDMFEAGTPNSHGLHGLRAGVSFINETGPEVIRAREALLTNKFLKGVGDVRGLFIYGDFSSLGGRLPVVSLNIKGMDSSRLAARLWEERRIAVRAGVHCAPLLHEALGTADRGAVRFSFSWYNTEDEILAGIEAIRAYAAETEENAVRAYNNENNDTSYV